MEPVKLGRQCKNSCCVSPMQREPNSSIAFPITGEPTLSKAIFMSHMFIKCSRICQTSSFSCNRRSALPILKGNWATSLALNPLVPHILSTKSFLRWRGRCTSMRRSPKVLSFASTPTISPKIPTIRSLTPSFGIWQIILVIIQVSSGNSGHKNVALAGITIINQLKTSAENQFSKEVQVVYLFVTPEPLPFDDAFNEAQKWSILSDYFKAPISSKLKSTGKVFFLGIPLHLSLLSKSDGAQIRSNLITKGSQENQWRLEANQRAQLVLHMPPRSAARSTMGMEA